MRAALYCIDKPGALQVRLDNRTAHRAHIDTSGVVEMAGPLMSPEGQMIGSLVVLSVDSLQQAQDWATADPYAKAGLFQSVTITEWNKIVG
jgi:hypothetical protein